MARLDRPPLAIRARACLNRSASSAVGVGPGRAVLAKVAVPLAGENIPLVGELGGKAALNVDGAAVAYVRVAALRRTVAASIAPPFEDRKLGAT